MPPSERPAPEAPPQPPAALPDQCAVPAPAPDEIVLPFDAAQSGLHIRAYRGGRLARLGHNHIVSAGAMWGYVRVAPRLEDSHFVLCLPVAELEVDKSELRAAAGADFAGRLDAAAVAGTRRNMLSEKLLDAARYPFVVIRGETTAPPAGDVPLRLTITVRDRPLTVTTRSEIAVTEQRVAASGRLELLQSDLGLEPYSALFGALLVRDRLEIRYALVAQ